MSFLSIDVGSSRCKAAIFSASGELLGLRSAAYASHGSRPGFSELKAETFLSAVISLSKELTSVATIEAVEAVCFSSHGETLIPVSSDGKALDQAILNMDVRATQEAAWMERQIGRRQLFMLTGHTSHAMYPIPKLMWLRTHAPELFAATSRFLSVTSYLLVQLGLPPLIDYSHASRFMAFDGRRHTWSKEVLDLAQVSPDVLPTPVQAGTVAGRLEGAFASMLGVPAGTPVVVGGHDQVVGAVGLGVIGPGRAAGSLGTYECITVASDELLLNEAALQASLNSYPHAVPSMFVTIAYLPGGIMTEWLARLFYGDSTDLEEDSHRFQELEASVPAGPSGLLITPHLIGSCNPEFDAKAHAAIVGLSIHSTRSDLYKGVLEGVASELAIVTKCLEDAGLRFNDINIFGGGTRSALGVHLRAAFTRKQLHIMQCQQAVCLGGAILASVAVGVHSNLQAAVSAMVREENCIEADPLLAEQYSAQIEAYRHVRSGLVHHHPPQHDETGEAI